MKKTLVCIVALLLLITGACGSKSNAPEPTRSIENAVTTPTGGQITLSPTATAMPIVSGENTSGGNHPAFANANNFGDSPFLNGVNVDDSSLQVATSVDYADVPVEESLAEYISRSYAIIKVKSVEGGKAPFEVLEIIKGDPAATKEFVQTSIFDKLLGNTYNLQEMAFIKPEGYKNNTNYVLFIGKGCGTVYEHGYTTTIWPVFIELNGQDGITTFGVEHKAYNKLKTVAELKAFLAERTKLNEYGMVHFEEEMQWYETTDFDSILANSPYVFTIKVIKKVFSAPFGNTYLCKRLQTLKGKLEWEEVEVIFFKNLAVVPGEEYVYISRNAEESLSPYIYTTFNPRSRNNSIIPMEDTQRVNTVYGLLGVQR